MKKQKTKKLYDGKEGKIEGVIDYFVSGDGENLLIYFADGTLHVHLPSYKRAGKLLIADIKKRDKK